MRKMMMMESRGTPPEGAEKTVREEGD